LASMSQPLKAQIVSCPEIGENPLIHQMRQPQNAKSSKNNT